MANDNHESSSPVELRGGMATVTMKAENLAAFQEWEKLKPDEKAFLITLAQNHPVFTKIMKAWVWAEGSVWLIFRLSAFIVAAAALITAWPRVMEFLFR